MNKIKIISGYSDRGGSTTAFINLTNFLNENDFDCMFYGPHSWPSEKCKFNTIDKVIFEPTDIVLFHFLSLPKRPDVKKSIFVCHEKWWFSFKDLTPFFDKCVFLHEEHRQFHKEYIGEYVIIPNLKENLKYKEKPNLDLIAGVIGSIEDRKQTHISIKRALEDGCEKVCIYGNIGEQEYFNKNILPLLKDSRIRIMGHSTNKQEMYDSIGRVYHSSKGEVACLVKDECYLTNTKFFGNEETNNEVSKLTNQEILEEWKKILI